MPFVYTRYHLFTSGTSVNWKFSENRQEHKFGEIRKWFAECRPNFTPSISVATPHWPILPEASFGLRVLPLSASVSVCVCVCVRACQLRVSPRKNLWPIQARITKLRWSGCRFIPFWPCRVLYHYYDVIMDTIASQITSLTINCLLLTVYSDADQRKHQSSASLAFVREIHRGPVNSPHKWPVTRKIFPFDDVIMLERFMTLQSGEVIQWNEHPLEEPRVYFGVYRRSCRYRSMVWSPKR